MENRNDLQVSNYQVDEPLRIESLSNLNRHYLFFFSSQMFIN